MNLNRSGWFIKYLEFRQEQPLNPLLPSTGIRVVESPGIHNDIDQAVYYFLQPTGLLYACPISYPFPDLSYPGHRYFDSLARAQVIFVDSLFACLVADRHFLLEGLLNEEDHLGPAVRSALGYFLAVPRQGSVPGLGQLSSLLRLRWGEGEPQYRFEREIKQRLTHGMDMFGRRDLFYNSFLFLDLYYCLRWQRHTIFEPDPDPVALRELLAEQELVQEALLKLLIAAAKPSGGSTAPEGRLVRMLLQSTRLPPGKLSELRKLLVQGLELDQIELPVMPWLVRRYFLELVLVTLMIDGEVSSQERELLTILVERLDLWQEEMDQSMTAVEVFLLSQADKLHLNHRRPLTLGLGEHLREQATLALKKNWDRIFTEIRETQELYALLLKATREPLTREEKRRVNAQLMDILKTVPALAIFALPGGGVALPILIRLLPFRILPSSFDD